MVKEKLDVEKLWRETNIMGMENRYYTRELINFLFGFCANDEQFLEAVDRYLTEYGDRKIRNDNP